MQGPMQGSAWAGTERIGTLAQRVLRTGNDISQTGYLFTAAPPSKDGSHIEASDAQTPDPAHVSFVRITFRPDPATDRVVATVEPLPDPPAAQSPRIASLPAHVRILEDIAQGASAASTAASVGTLLDEQAGLTSIVMRYETDSQTLHPLTSPRLDTPSRALSRDAFSVQDCALCRAAVHEHSWQYHDLTDDAWLKAISPDWHRIFEHTEARTCWTVPVVQDASNVLGVIVFLFRAPQRHAATDLALIETAVQLIHIALERDQQADDLREHTERLRQMTETMNEVFWLRTIDKVLHVSPSFENVWGRPVEDLYADPDIYLEDVHPGDRDRISEACRNLLQKKNPVSADYRIIRKSDGETRWVRVNFRPVDNPTGPARFAGTARDVTERKRQQEELREAKQQAEDADRLKSAMLANMSHEIRTPLTSIIGFAEVLRDEVAPTHQHFAGLIYDSSRRLMQTLDSVLQLSKLEAGLVDVENVPVNLQQELRETLDLMRPQAQDKAILLSVRDLPAITVTGTWDGGAVHRILTNLVSNAIKFTNEGGSVEISVEERAGKVIICVSDDGIGIDPSFMPHIFEPFKQETSGMRRSYEGTGLGLAIVQRLVEIMGGTIDVESEKGRGTTFTVILPSEPDVGSVSLP